MKISRASWVILASGVFIIVLAGLGMTRSGQMAAEDKLAEDLQVAQARLSNLQVTQLQTQINEYNAQLNDAKSQADDILQKLKQTVISVDVAEKFFVLADYYGVTINNITTSSIAQQPFASVNCETISLSASVSGELENLINFIIGLNNNFSTGFVRAAQLSINGEEASGASVQMTVYSQKGS